MSSKTTSPSASSASSVYVAPGGGTPLQGIKVVFSVTRDNPSRDTGTHQIINVQLWELNGNDADYHRLLDEKQLDIDDSTLNATDALLPAWITQDWITGNWVPYDGASPADTGWVEIRVRDILVLRLSPYNTNHANSTGLDTICDTTTAGSKWVGLVFDGNQFTTPTGTPDTLEAHAFGGQVVRGTAASTPVLHVGSSDVVAATKERFDVGTRGVEQTLTQCTAVGATPSLPGPQVLMCPLQYQCVSPAPADWPAPSPNASRTYMFCVDGNNAVVVNPYERTVGTWLNVTSVTAPDALSRCRGIAREPWRGRLCIFHPDSAPNTVYFSKVGDPTNWTWGTTAGDAFKLDASSSYGVPADAVTAAIPLSDDIFLIGCATRKYYLKGDPTAGGSFKDVPGEGGIIGPKALCKGGEGRLFYLSQSGLRCMRFAGEIIEDKAIGDHRVDDILSRVSTFDTTVELAYEALNERLHIYLTPDDGAGTHIVLDVGDNAMWLFEFADEAVGPSASCPMAGRSPDDNRVLLGGKDGVIREYAFGEPADDGTPIDAWVRFPVVTLAQGHQMVNVVEIQAVAEPGSAAVEWMLFVAASADEINRLDITTATPAASGTWFGDGTGFQQPVDPGVAGGAVQLCIRQVSASGTFALSEATIVVEPWGERRL